jgi:hypothetical protein
VCPGCQADARFVGYRGKTILSVNGEMRLERAYYHCKHCKTGHFPLDQTNQLQDDHISPGLRPLVCLAGVLNSFRDGADDILGRFCGVRISASSVRRITEEVGEELQKMQQAGDVIVPQNVPSWNFKIEGQEQTVAYLGLDAFSIPIQKPRGAKAEGRMLYVGTLYTPNKEKHHYVVDFDLSKVASQMRQAATKLGLGNAEKVIAISDAGSGLEAALKRNFNDGMLCILDWYHATQHLYQYAKVAYSKEEEREEWMKEAKRILMEEGGKKLGEHLGKQKCKGAAVKEELRQLKGYFKNNEERTDYPQYRKNGWDIGSGPTEAACKVVGERLKQSGMRWFDTGAGQVACLRALYLSDAWDTFWACAV